MRWVLKKTMILFSFPSYEYLARKLRKLPGWQRGNFSIGRYQNQELFTLVKTPVRGQKCAILAETAPPDTNLLSLLLLAHTLKKEGAKEIIAIIPYLGYSRHDKKEPARDLATQWLGESLKNAGVSEVITIDAHSELDEALFPIPLNSLPSAEILAKAISNFPLDKTTLLAPDEGAIDNCRAIRNALGKKIDIAFFQKKKTLERVTLSKLRGTVKERAVVVDDMLDTGETLLRCAEKLRQLGMRKITVLVSHGLFTGKKWRRLWSLGVQRIYCTNTFPLAKKMASKQIKVLPASEILLKYFSAAYDKRN